MGLSEMQCSGNGLLLDGSKSPGILLACTSVNALEMSNAIGGWHLLFGTYYFWTTVTPDLNEFLASLDMFYLGTANVEGQPYIQYRGGSPGFLKVLDEKRLAFADFGGNRQYITLGNLSENPKAFIFLMDYAISRRVKLRGEDKVVEEDTDLLNQLRDPEYPGKVERAIVFEIEAWDINCPQHIHKRYAQ